MRVTAPHHGPYDFTCRRSHHGSLESVSVVLSTGARLNWLCFALSFLFCCMSPSTIPVKFCHTVNSELPWFQEEFGGYKLLVESSSSMMTLSCPNIASSSYFSMEWLQLVASGGRSADYQVRHACAFVSRVDLLTTVPWRTDYPVFSISPRAIFTS